MRNERLVFRIPAIDALSGECGRFGCYLFGDHVYLGFEVFDQGFALAPTDEAGRFAQRHKPFSDVPRQFCGPYVVAQFEPEAALDLSTASADLD